MSALRLCYLRSVAELRAVASKWDALWQRSDVSLPLARAEFIAQWVTQFSPAAELLILAVEDGEEFIAALPLIGHRGTAFFDWGGITSNNWGLCGELLLDGSTRETAALALLAEGLNHAPWPWICLRPIAYEARRWRALIAAAREAGLSALAIPSATIGQVRIEGGWNEYQASWSGNHRRHLRKAMKRAKRSGELTLEAYSDVAAQDLPPLFRRGCEIEDRSWKGASGTSILRAPGMYEWHLRQAALLAEYGHLQLSFLKHADRTIAFEYGYRAKETYFSAKVGYDDAYADCSPGQLLRAMLFESFFSSGGVRLVDFWGPLSNATSKWMSDDYAVGKLFIAPRRLLGRLALRAYGVLRPYWHTALKPGRPGSER